MTVFSRPLLKDWRFWTVIVWFAFTITLASWQMIFAHQTLLELSGLSSSDAENLGRHIRMVRMESLTMLTLLVLGGLGLTFLLRRERSANETLRRFLATFTHELKTSLSSLRLQAEVLESSLSRIGANNRADRILSDLMRLDLQLENSLNLAKKEDEQLFPEEVTLREALSGVQHAFPIVIHLNRDCKFRVDRHLFESIIKNVIQNSKLHGKAENLYFEVKLNPNQNQVLLSIEDDGSGSEIDPSRIGELFYRPTSGSKNGIGLYLVQRFSKRLGGEAQFYPKSDRGFRVELSLPGELL